MAIEPNIDDLKYEMQEESIAQARIKVVGIGGGGSNAVAHMMSAGLDGVDFYVLNTDAQALASSPVPNKLAIGSRITKGRGAGADPAVGREAALEDTERIVEILQGSDMVFITAGLGSGTGTGAAPVVASLARELNALTVAIVTKPFTFEGSRRMRQAEAGVADLTSSVDTLLTIPNDRLLSLAPRGTSMVEAFRMGHELLRQMVADLVDIITTPGLINRDFSDIRATMLGQGYAMMGAATAQGENSAVEAARQAMQCPLLEDHGIRGATNILINITGSSRLGLHEVNEACALIREAAATPEAQVNFGIVVKEAMEDSVKVMVLATGFNREPAPVAAPLSAPLAEPVFAAADPVLTSSTPDWFPAPSFPPEPMRIEEPAPEPPPPVVAEEPYVPPQQPQPQPEDLDDLDTPAYLRHRRMSR